MHRCIPPPEGDSFSCVTAARPPRTGYIQQKQACIPHPPQRLSEPEGPWASVKRSAASGGSHFGTMLIRGTITRVGLRHPRTLRHSGAQLRRLSRRLRHQWQFRCRLAVAGWPSTFPRSSLASSISSPPPPPPAAAACESTSRASGWLASQLPDLSCSRSAVCLLPRKTLRPSAGPPGLHRLQSVVSLQSPCPTVNSNC